jgi:hypothetical protein
MSDNIENVSFEPAPAEKFPRCPYCKQLLETIWVKTDGIGLKGKREICMCPHCEAFLAYSAWKR